MESIALKILLKGERIRQAPDVITITDIGDGIGFFGPPRLRCYSCGSGN
jgi:hypothetical protein